MDLHVLITESAATLHDPAFAIGFALTSLLVMVIAMRSALEITRRHQSRREVLFFTSLLLVLALCARMLILIYASAANAVLEPGVSIHYWGVAPCVYAIWGAAALAFLATIVFRVLSTRGAVPS